MNKNEPPLRDLGEFLVVFQAIEAAVTDMIEFILDGDREYIHALSAELEFSSKLRALDVIFTRWARINQLTDASPHPEFHRFITKLLEIANRRNEIVHSFYNLLITVDGTLALTRRPTRLRPSKGERHDPVEDIMPGALGAEIQDMRSKLQELGEFRRLVLDRRYPPD